MGEEGHEALDLVPLRRLDDQDEAMVPIDHRLGLDGDSVACGGRGRDVGQEQGAGRERGRAGLGWVPVLGDEEGLHQVAGRLAEAHFRRGTGHDALEHVAALANNDALDGADSVSRGSLALREGLIRLLYGKGAHKQILTAGHALTRVGRATGNARIRTMGERAEGVALIFLGRLTEGVAILEPALPRGLAAGDRE